jgi:hypothetical protein
MSNKVLNAHIKEMRYIRRGNYMQIIKIENLRGLILDNYEEIENHMGNCQILFDIYEFGVFDVYEAAQAYTYIQYILYSIKPDINNLIYVGNKNIIMNYDMNHGKYVADISLSY